MIPTKTSAILNEAGTYASFHLLPEAATKLFEFVEKLLPDLPLQLASSYHITTVYSRNEIQHEPEPYEAAAAVPVGYEYLGREGDDPVIVLRVEHPKLHQRFNTALANGGSHDFPSYLPHITLTKKIPGKPVDLTKLQLPNWDIQLGQEHTEVLREQTENND
jgi:hypothetical protein